MVAATGPLSLPFAELAALTAASATFRSVTGAASEAAALDFIHHPFYDVEANGGWPVPGIVIADHDALSQEKGQLGDQRGEILWQILLPSNPLYDDPTNDPPLDDPASNLRDFRNKVGAILNEMQALARGPKTNPADGFFMNFQRWRKVGAPTRVGPPDFAEPFLYAAFVVEWI